MVDDWPIVGRERERAAVRLALQGRHRSGLVLAGPAGTGKTRLAIDARTFAEREGWLTQTVAGSAATRTFPLAAMAPLIPPSAIGGADLPVLLSRAHDAVTARTGERDLLLVIDDAHALDEASAMLAYQLAATGAAFVIATVRTGEQVPDPVTALWKDGLADRVDLEPLAQADIEQLAARVLGGPVSHEAVRELAERSAGNALYLRELILGARSGGALAVRAGLWQLTRPLMTTPRLTELVSGNLAGLDEPSRAVVELLAVGEPLSVEDLASVGGSATVDRLEQRGLIRVRADGHRLVARFGHPLYGDVVRQSMPALRTRAVASRLADLVIAAGARRDDDPLRIAAWRLQAGERADPDVFLRGARLARRRHDQQLTRDLAFAAVRHGGGPEARLLAATASSVLGDHEACQAALDAIDLEPLGAAERFAVHLARLEDLIHGQSRFVDGIVLIERTLRDATPCPARDEIELYRHQFMFFGGQADALERIRAIADRNEGARRGVVLAMYALNLANVGRLAETLAVCDTAETDLRDAVEPIRWHSQGLDYFRAIALADAGRLDEAGTVAQAAYDACLAARQFDVLGWLAGAMSRVMLARGRIDDAVRWARQGASASVVTGWTFFAAYSHLICAVALAASGAADDARVEIDLACAMGMGGPGFEAHVALSQARVRASTGDTAGAAAELQRCADLARTAMYRPLELTALHGLVRLGRHRDLVRARELAAVVEGPLPAACLEHMEAVLADDAPALLRSSHSFERTGALLLAAEAAADAAVRFRGVGEPRAGAAAQRRAGELAARCPGAQTPALRVEVRHRLTAGEQRIAELAARGLRSKEIAAELSVAVRTVDNTLQRVYAKLGVGGRGELAAALT